MHLFENTRMYSQVPFTDVLPRTIVADIPSIVTGKMQTSGASLKTFDSSRIKTVIQIGWAEEDIMV